MFCSKCGSHVAGGSQFCARCGAAVQPADPTQGYVPYQTPPVQRCEPIAVQQPSSPLRPALRHPFFYVCGLVYLICACFSVYDDLEYLFFALSRHDSERLYWLFTGILPTLLAISVTLLTLIGLILLFAAGLHRDGPVPEGGFTLLRVALVISLVDTIYSVLPTLARNIQNIRYAGERLIPYSVTNMVTSLLISIPLAMVLCIFAIKTNQTALSMAKGRNTRISGALPVMLFVQTGVTLLLGLLQYNSFPLGYELSTWLLSVLPTLIPKIFFGILLLIMPQK